MNVLFVCTANVTRSAISEAILKKFVSDEGLESIIQVRSAGTEAVDGIPPMKNTVIVCEKHGIDITQHTSRHLDPKELEEADLVLCLSESHKKMIMEMHPGFDTKVFLLKEYGQYVLPENVSVDDPTGQSMEKFQACFDELYGELIRIFPSIIRDAHESSVQ